MLKAQGAMGGMAQRPKQNQGGEGGGGGATKAGREGRTRDTPAAQPSNASSICWKQQADTRVSTRVSHHAHGRTASCIPSDSRPKLHSVQAGHLPGHLPLKPVP